MIATPSLLTDPAVPSPDLHVVTSSILVRHFGLWGQRAAQAPVTILQHNRPRHVLVAIDHWNALLARAARRMAPSVGADHLINAVSDLVIGLDSAGAITATSRTARAQFGPLIQCGRPLEDIMVASDYGRVRDVLRQVVNGGLGAMVDLPSLVPPGKAIAWAIIPYHDGVALIGRDDGATTA